MFSTFYEHNMRGDHIHQHELFSYGSLDGQVPSDHPLLPMRTMVDEELKALNRRPARGTARNDGNRSRQNDENSRDVASRTKNACRHRSIGVRNRPKSRAHRLLHRPPRSPAKFRVTGAGEAKKSWRTPFLDFRSDPSRTRPSNPKVSTGIEIRQVTGREAKRL